MKPGLLYPILVLLGTIVLPSLVKADAPQLSADRLNLLDERGYFTPTFKAAVHDLVDARQEIVQAKEDEKKARASLPDLQQQAAAAMAETNRLQKELDLYAHPEDTDFDALQAAMKNPAISAQQRMVLAQAFVWSYPTDPHQAEAEQDLRQIQKQLADLQQAEKDAEAVRIAAQAKLLQRAQARDLSLEEWQDFLRDKSQGDLVGLLGRPQREGPDYWIYTGDWTVDPATKAKVGLQIHFNGTRVLSVAPQDHSF
jgi:hypothetical protein